MQLILASEATVPTLAKSLAVKVNQAVDASFRDRIVKFIETVLAYKFPQLSQQEIEAMFTLGDLKQTRVYQDAMKEGEKIGEQRGEQRGLQIGAQRELSKILVRLLTRKFGKVSPRFKTRLSKMPVEQLEDLAEAIFDFETVADLNA